MGSRGWYIEVAKHGLEAEVTAGWCQALPNKSSPQLWGETFEKTAQIQRTSAGRTFENTKCRKATAAWETAPNSITHATGMDWQHYSTIVK